VTVRDGRVSSRVGGSRNARVACHAVDATVLDLTTCLAAVVESGEEAILAITRDGVIDCWNAAAERVYGYAADE
jgi:PAS domain-containing protein